MEVQELKNKVDTLPIQAEGYQVTNNEENQKASDFLMTIKGLRKEINNTFDPIINKAHSAHKEAIAQKKKHSEPLDQAERLLKGKITIYIENCERKRREEQLRLEAEAKAKQEAEAERLAAQAEANGDAEEANEIIQEAIEAPPVVVAPQINQKVDGISSRKTWAWTIKDPDKINRKFLMVDTKKINSTVRAMGKDAELTIGGIQVSEKTTISARSN